MSGPVHIYQVFIGAKVDDVWNAIIDGEQTKKYFYGTRVESDWEPGSPIVYYNPDGSVAADGEVVGIDPPKRLEMTFTARWDPELEAEGPAREVWLVEEAGPMAKLTIELYEVATDSKTYQEFTSGFAYIASSLKTLLETGESLPSPY